MCVEWEPVHKSRNTETEYVNKFTELSNPSVSSMRKKMIAQNVDPGNVAMAIG